MRRSEIRRALDRLPVLGPVVVSAFRRGRDIWKERRGEKEIEPERFHALYKERNQIDDLRHITDPVKKMYVDFALSTVSRGRTVVQRIAAHTDPRGKSYLDVGCAYGGFLVAFKNAGASRVVGIDVNPGLLDYARALLEDYRTSADVRHLDILDSERSAELGRFDLITCNDVIEHVLDPAKALQNLGALLSDGGTLYLEIPNRWSASFVLSDGHHQIFGLTVLPKEKADAYFRELRGLTHDVTYKSLPFYINRLAALGYSTRLMRSIPADVPASLEQIASTFAECERHLNGETPPSLDRHVRRIARVFYRGQEKYRNLSRTDKGTAEAFGETLWLMFGSEFWTLFVERRPQRARPARWSQELG